MNVERLVWQGFEVTLEAKQSFWDEGLWWTKATMENAHEGVELEAKGELSYSWLHHLL